MANPLLRSSLELLLLGVLRHGPAHGYAIIAALRERSDGEFDLAEGSIYPALHRLEDAGLVESSEVSVSGRRRRTYRLTARGEQEFAERRTAWFGFTQRVQAVVGSAT